VKRLALYLAIVLAALVLVSALGWWWLTSTQSGAAFVLRQADARVEGLSYSSPRGTLGGGLELERLALRQGSLELELDRVDLAIRPGLFPLRLQVKWLRVAGADVQLPPPGPEPADPGPFRLGDALGDFSAPLIVDVDELEIRDIVVRQADAETDSPMLELRRVSLAGRYADQLRLERAVAESEDWRVELRGDAGLTSPWRMALEAEGSLDLDDDSTQQVELDANGPLDQLNLNFEASGPARLRGEVALDELLNTPEARVRASVTGQVADWPGLPPSLDALELNIEGGLDDWRAALAGRVDWPGQPVAELDLELEGSDRIARVTRGEVRALDGSVSLQGQAELADGEVPAKASATIGLDRLNPAALVPDWPTEARINGGFGLDWNGRVLRISDLSLDVPPSPLRVSGDASLNAESQTLDLSLEWSALRWPLIQQRGEDAREPPLFSSESGRLEGSGTLDEWSAELEAWLTLPDQPRARLDIRADGDRSVVNLNQGLLAFDEAGRARVTGRVALSDPPSARLDVRMDQFDPGAFVAELSGRLSGDIGLNVEATQPPRASLELAQLEGEIRQVEVTGNGRAAFSGAVLERGALNLQVGANRLELNSGEGEAWRVEIQASRLEQLWPELSGELRASAEVAPTRQQAEWSLESPGLAWGQIRTAQVTSNGSLNWGQAPSVDLALNAADVDLNPWERLERVEVLLDGGCAAHRLRGYVGGSRATVDLELQGRMPECINNPSRWQGALQRLVIAETPVGAWQLDGPLDIVYNAEGLSAGPGCLWTTSSDGRLCLNELEAGASGTARLAFNSVPVDMLLLPTDPVFTLGNNLKGLARVDWGPDGIRQIDSRLLMDAGAVRMLDSDDDLISIQGADLVLRSPRDGALNARLGLRFEQQSEVTAVAAIPDINNLGSTRVDARANLLLPNLGTINRLVPELDQLGGRLEADLQVRGALTSPELDGRAAIREGQFRYAPLGTNVTGLDLVLEANEQGGALDGSFTAGDGAARISGQLEPGREVGWAGQASIVGQQLGLFDADWLEMTVSPDLRIGFTTDLLELNGVVAIDRARLGLPPGTESRVPVSDDVVIVDGAEQEVVAEPEPPPRDIAGTVQLRLGDDTRLEAAGMETRLAGDLDVEWTPSQPLPAGRGLIELLEGSYRAYGQNLEVTEGDVLFTGNPIDNPVLDIEAVREIFGDPQVERAGVRIRGPAQNPDISLFTAPPTSREKALAYILTGADFDHAAGQGAFSVGFWVLPEVFVSYGLGLFDTGNVLAVRWELSRRWGLRATSGERDTGADISFIIDR